MCLNCGIVGFVFEWLMLCLFCLDVVVCLYGRIVVMLGCWCFCKCVVLLGFVFVLMW